MRAKAYAGLIFILFVAATTIATFATDALDAPSGATLVHDLRFQAFFMSELESIPDEVRQKIKKFMDLTGPRIWSGANRSRVEGTIAWYEATRAAFTVPAQSPGAGESKSPNTIVVVPVEELSNISKSQLTWIRNLGKTIADQYTEHRSAVDQVLVDKLYGLDAARLPRHFTSMVRLSYDPSEQPKEIELLSVTQVPPEAIAYIAVNVSTPTIAIAAPTVHDITVDQAKALSAGNRHVRLSFGKESVAEHAIGRDVLEAFSGSSCEITLSGIGHLSGRLARSLVEHQGVLRLEQLESIDEQAAVALSQHRGRLVIGGADDLSRIKRSLSAESWTTLISHDSLKELGSAVDERDREEREAELARRREVIEENSLRAPASAFQTALAAARSKANGAKAVNDRENYKFWLEVCLAITSFQLQDFKALQVVSPQAKATAKSLVEGYR